jgi:hypothetical protein
MKVRPARKAPGNEGECSPWTGPHPARKPEPSAPHRNRAPTTHDPQAPGAYWILCIGGQGLPAVEVATPAPAIRLGPQLPLKLHEAPDPGAVGAEVRLDLGGQLVDGGQVDAEQFGASLQRRRDRPAQVRVVPGPH